MELPLTMKAWQYGTVTNGLENSLNLNASAPLPTPKPDQHLIKIHSVSLSPVDHKPQEVAIFRRLMVPNPATPGIDFSGTIVRPAPNSPFKPGDRVFGCGTSPFAGGCLAEYAVAGTDSTVAVPSGVSLEDASTIGVAGLTAYQSIVPYIPTSGTKRIFLNGGSGGVGTFGIQIARTLGCDVVATCSGRNVELCRRLGASDVIDYTQNPDLVKALSDKYNKANGNEFDHVIDNVLTSAKLYLGAQRFSKPEARFIVVGGGLSLRIIWENIKMKTVPGFLGGGKRKLMGFFAQANTEQLKQIADWIAEGKVEAVVDSKFAFEDAREAFKKLKTGRARGKIVVLVEGEGKS